MVELKYKQLIKNQIKTPSPHVGKNLIKLEIERFFFMKPIILSNSKFIVINSQLKI